MNKWRKKVRRKGKRENKIFSVVEHNPNYTGGKKFRVKYNERKEESKYMFPEE